MGTVASVLSKLERTGEADPEIAERYLSAVGSDLSEEVLGYYARAWSQEGPPSFLHPDHEALWAIDDALQALDGFEKARNDPILRGPIDLQRGALRDASAYLRRRDHVVAWLGDIGVGKTTALTYAVGLLVGDGRSGRRPAFPVGAGRITVCETAIRVAPTHGVLVDPLDEEEVIRLTRELVTSLLPAAAGVGVPAEMARLLRTMSGMKVSTRMAGDDPVSTDPIADLLADGLGVDEVTDRVVAAMSLADRKERQIILPEGSDDGLLWVSKLVSNINSGADSRFGVPDRITVLMPSKNLSADGQALSVVDTRGVESVTQRPDLAKYGEDERALIVLCTKFANAPDATVQRYLQEAVGEGSNAAALNRRCILVLPRGEEALEAPGFDGPISRAQGYALRRKEIEQALIASNLPVTPIYFFDARNDDADKIWASLRAQVSQMRAVYADRALAAAAAVKNLIDNVEDVRAAEARRDIECEMERLLTDVRILSPRLRPAHQNLVDQIAIGHHSSLAASISRKGRWGNFQFAHILGNGVRIDANLRSNDHAMRIEFKLRDLESKYAAQEGVVQTLTALRGRLGEGRQEFLASARSIGADAYGALLADHADIWTDSAARYGLGVGYKQDIASKWRNWFEQTPDAHRSAKMVDERLQDAWVFLVLSPLADATRTEPAAP